MLNLAEFRSSTYSTQYDNPDEIPDDIIANNAFSVTNILKHPTQFPKADFESCERDLEFLTLECAIRCLQPHSVLA